MSSYVHTWEGLSKEGSGDKARKSFINYKPMKSNIENKFKTIRFLFLASLVFSLFVVNGCKSMVIKDDDSASDKTKKVLGRIFIGVGTFGISEGTIEDYEKEYDQEKKKSAVLRNISIFTLQAIENIGKAENEIVLMTRQQQEEKIKYYMVIANNLLDNADNKVKGLKDIKDMGDIAKQFKDAVMDIVNKKKQLIAYWLKKEYGAAAAYQTLTNQKIIEILDKILQLSSSNKYIFSQDEIYKIIRLREEWTKLTKFRFQPSPKQTF